MDPRNHVLVGVHIPMRRGNFEGEGASHCEVQGHSAVICARTVEPIEMPFGWWLVWAQEIVLHGGLDPPWKGVIIRGEVAAHCSYSDTVP